MHPILGSPRRLMLYLLVWVPILGLLAYLSGLVAGAAWRETLVALAPACFLSAFICLTPWYLCRARPMNFAALPGSVGMWLGAAMVDGAVLPGVTWLVAWTMGWDLTRAVALLYGIGVLLYLLSAGLHYGALAVEASNQAERRAAEARTLAREAQLQALKFQINPHFLFNSLHSIAALATMDGVRAREMCVRLSEFLRSSLALGDRESIPLREELALATSYLEVERVRFGERLRVEEEIEGACEECSVPALLLQPLVENAVKHGVAGLLEGGAIRLAAQRHGGAVAITLENAFDPDNEAPRKLGLGLEHVRRRLAVRYGGEAVFEAGPADGLYRVVLRLPCEAFMAASKRE